jgi:hypothetical protein
MTNDITTLLLVIAPAALVVASNYIILRRMIEADQRRRAIELRIHTRNETIKIRLHAIEQLMVLMEHFAPAEFVLRHARSTSTVSDLQVVLLDVVRKEMENYLSFQLYVNIDTWQLVAGARNSLVSLINRAAATVAPNEQAINLAKKIIELAQAEQESFTSDAIEALRKEAKLIYD